MWWPWFPTIDSEELTVSCVKPLVFPEVYNPTPIWLHLLQAEPSHKHHTRNHSSGTPTGGGYPLATASCDSLWPVVGAQNLRPLHVSEPS